MDGEIIYFDGERGFVAGSDGNRYVFDRQDLSATARPAKGDRVTFRPDGDRAREIVTTGAPSPPAVTPARPGTAPAGPFHPVPRIAERPLPPPAFVPTPDSGALGYFLGAVTRRYADFLGRARRKEFWSFAFVAAFLLIAAATIGAAFDFASGNLYPVETDKDFAFDGAPWVTLTLLGGLVLFLLVPSLALTVRRIHDIGLPGWLVLLGFVPSIGNLIMLGFALWPSSRAENAWGPVPSGIEPRPIDPVPG